MKKLTKLIWALISATLIPIALLAAGCATTQLRFVNADKIKECETISYFETPQGTKIACCRNTAEWLCIELGKKKMQKHLYTDTTPPIPRSYGP